MSKSQEMLFAQSALCVETFRGEESFTFQKPSISCLSGA